jgi:Tfp pilus assembly protein FimT
MLTRKNTKDRKAPAKEPRRGVTAMEYLMMLSLIIIVCLVAVSYLGNTNNTNMSNSATSISKSIKTAGQ